MFNKRQFNKKVLNKAASTNEAPALRCRLIETTLCLHANLAIEKQRSPATRATRNANHARNSQRRPEAEPEIAKHTRACSQVSHPLEHGQRSLSRPGRTRMGRVSQRQRHLCARAS